MPPACPSESGGLVPANRGSADRPNQQNVSGKDMRARSRVAGSLLGELHARAEPEFVVDVGEVGLHGAR